MWMLAEVEMLVEMLVEMQVEMRIGAFGCKAQFSVNITCFHFLLKGTWTRDLIWLKAVSLDRSWLEGLTDDL